MVVAHLKMSCLCWRSAFTTHFACRPFALPSFAGTALHCKAHSLCPAVGLARGRKVGLSCRVFCSTFEEDLEKLSRPRGSRGKNLRWIKRQLAVKSELERASQMLSEFSQSEDESACGSSEDENIMLESVEAPQTMATPVEKFRHVVQFLNLGEEEEEMDCHKADELSGKPEDSVEKKVYGSQVRWDMPYPAEGSHRDHEQTVLPIRCSKIPYTTFPKQLTDTGRKILKSKFAADRFHFGHVL